MVNRESLMNSKKDVRVVFYDRFCSSSKSQYKVMADIEQKHNELLHKHANWIATHKYCEIGISGTQIKNRPQLSSIMQDATEGKFDLLVVQNISRIARNPTLVLKVVDKLHKSGVEVFFINEGIWSFTKNIEKVAIMLAEAKSIKIIE